MKVHKEIVMRRRWIGLGAILTIIALGAATLSFGGNSIRKEIFAQAMPVDYFAEYGRITPDLYKVSGSTYAFEREFSRSMVLRTPEGIAIFDTFDTPHMKALKEALAEKFPGENVRWVVLSHNHLDHVRGSTVFPDADIIGHENINKLVADWPNVNKDVALVTTPISEDQNLTLGGVVVKALFVPFSHSHTLYGFHIPADDVVFAPDMMFVNAMPPFGFPDFYYPGYIRALDRLIAVDAKHYVPSHLDRGTRQDLIAFRNMTVEFQHVVEDEYRKIDPVEFPRGVGMREAVRSAYDRLQPKYGHIHGFDDMFVPKFGRHIAGTYLGY